jgi:opacity protein-like surface antigen
MKRVLVALGFLAISTTTASAGGYLGLALGTQPAVNDEFQQTAQPSDRSFRALGGVRFGNVSIEGAVNDFGVITGRGDQSVIQLSAALKLGLPLGNGFEAFGRAGIERTWLNLDDDRYDYTGNGFQLGAGFEYRFSLGVTGASLFVDYTIHHATLENTRIKVDETSRVWGLGFTLAI